MRKLFALAACWLGLAAFAGAASAQSWSPEQQEIWKFEEQQWKMAAAKDMSWMDTMVHPNMRYWETGDPMPRDRASLKHWARHMTESSTVLEQEIFPISATITGNVAVVQYHYMVASEDHKKERRTVTGRYTDVLIKENGRWLFIAWTGGDNPKD
jgi:type II restriction/modification system DNA methylase subunit YeeA